MFLLLGCWRFFFKNFFCCRGQIMYFLKCLEVNATRILKVFATQPCLEFLKETFPVFLQKVDWFERKTHFRITFVSSLKVCLLQINEIRAFLNSVTCASPKKRCVMIQQRCSFALLTVRSKFRSSWVFFHILKKKTGTVKNTFSEPITITMFFFFYNKNVKKL